MFHENRIVNAAIQGKNKKPTNLINLVASPTVYLRINSHDALASSTDHCITAT